MKNKIIKTLAITLALATTFITACGNVADTGSDGATAATATDSGFVAENSTAEGSKEVDPDSYEAKLFDTSYVHSIDIEISDEDWADLLENPKDQTKYKVNITIDGETINEVSFSTKGNNSLESVASDEESDRYSFKINFGKYVDGQTYHGLDKLKLNNTYADATYVKDYLSYYLFNYMGVDAPLASFVNITVNGEEWGLYVAVEGVSDSFLDRTENTEGELYKPEPSKLSNLGKNDEDGKPENMPEGQDESQKDKDDKKKSGNTDEKPDGQADGKGFGQPPEGFDPENMPEGFDSENLPEGFDPGKGFGGFGGFGESNSSASLKYTDDNIESYADIFDNNETEVTEEDQKRLIQSLKDLSEGNIEDSINIDSVIDYFAVHNFVMNYDSYTGSFLHNYYLYEEDGKLTMIPWDYNLGFGNFMNVGGGPGKDGENKDSGATGTINYGIDSPLSTASEEDRPMWAWIVSDEKYTQQYHDSLQKLITYVQSDEFKTEVDRLYEMLYPYVEEDATAFFTADEFTTGFNTLKEFIELRAESIQKQIDGELATVTDEQKDEDKVDGSSININDMGSQGGPGGPGGDKGGPQGFGKDKDE